VVRPVNSCGGIPRDTMMAQRSLVATASRLSLSIRRQRPRLWRRRSTAAAHATAPAEAMPAPYASPNAMIEAADMAAFHGARAE